ncbi:MAG: sigma-70 family RNA polymerase sigma factor, partial [Mycobacterium sp.]|nr:sigma-70 family RNA polymerase sigma factor [Mycobacterium sp.]
MRSLYAEYGRMLLGYAYRLTGDRQRAEDVVQETLLRAWRHAESLTAERGSVRSWLLTVARNVVVDMSRARQVRPIEVGGGPGDIAVAGSSVPDQTTDVENAVIVERALAQLSPEYRAVLVEVYLNGRTATEASRVLQIPVGTVKSRTHHALRALRARLVEMD